MTLVYWAPSKEAIMRCVFSDLSVSVPPLEENIPVELSLKTPGTYGALKKTREIQVVPVSESAIYHVETGEFVHKLLDSTKLIYYFLKRRLHENEKPYAIEVRF